MIKLTFCLVRAPHLTLDEFSSYWAEKHAPLVKSLREALRLQRYVQTHGVELEASAAFRKMRGGPAPFDGVAQLWWNGIEDVKYCYTDNDAKRAGRILLEDERNFIDLARSPLWWGEERCWGEDRCGPL
jgi:uncharacterized protein (TIGR02118 family)